MNWVPVKERRPRIGSDVLVTSSLYETMIVARCIPCGSGYNWLDYADRNVDGVLAWTTLPAPWVAP